MVWTVDCYQPFNTRSASWTNGFRHNRERLRQPIRNHQASTTPIPKRRCPNRKRWRWSSRHSNNNLQRKSRPTTPTGRPTCLQRTRLHLPPRPHPRRLLLRSHNPKRTSPNNKKIHRHPQSKRTNNPNKHHHTSPTITTDLEILHTIFESLSLSAR